MYLTMYTSLSMTPHTHLAWRPFAGPTFVGVFCISLSLPPALTAAQLGGTPLPTLGGWFVASLFRPGVPVLQVGVEAGQSLMTLPK